MDSQINSSTDSYLDCTPEISSIHCRQNRQACTPARCSPQPQAWIEVFVRNASFV